MEISSLVVLIAALFGLAAIVWVPRFVVPESRSSKYEDRLKVAASRNIIRGTIAQIVAGLAFVATFIQSAQNFNLDFRQRTEHATAELFANAIFKIDDQEF